MGEIKQTNFRIDVDAADAFRKFCEEQGLSQAQGFDHIMQVMELDRAKAAVPERLTEIEGFEKSLKEILSAYINSIAINTNAEARIREQFTSSLASKDITIANLKETIDRLTSEKDEAAAGKESAKEAQAAAEERRRHAEEQMTAAQKAAEDKERINSMLTRQLADATEKLGSYQDMKAANESLEKQVAEIRHKLELQESEARTNMAQAQAKAELERERAVMDKEREMQSQIREVDRENAKLLAKIEQLEERIAALTAQQ